MLGCYRQALFALAWFRDKGDIPRLGAGFGLAQSTACRYLDEVIEVLAARTPGLQEQLERALAGGTPYLVLDGKIVDTDRCREKTTSRKWKTIDLWYEACRGSSRSMALLCLRAIRLVALAGQAMWSFRFSGVLSSREHLPGESPSSPAHAH